MHKDQYPLVFNRRLGFDQRVWQIPSLAIAAQAVLLSGALNPSATWKVSVGLALLSTCISAAVLQLMAKLRQLEIEDAERLRVFESKQSGYAVLHGDRSIPKGIKRGLFVRMRSYHIWRFLLISILVFGIVCFIGIVENQFDLTPLV